MQNKTLTFDFGVAGNTGTVNVTRREMILDLSNVGSGVAFKGNINIIGGRAQKWTGENKFQATFGGDVIGNIAGKKYDTYYDMDATYTFKNSASLKGNFSAEGNPVSVTSNQAQHKLNFIDGTITGGITAKNKAKVSVIFSPTGSNQSSQTKTWIGGDISSASNSNVEVTIKNNSSGDAPENIIQGNITATADGYGGAGNKIDFQTTTKNKIDGNISVSTSNFDVSNTITFNGNSTNTITGNISGSGTGINTITATNGSLTIGGNITTQWNKNTISAQTLTIGSEEKKSSIKATGNQATKETSNTITATGALKIYATEITTNNTSHSKNTITGGTNSEIIVDNITANAGSNTIKLVTNGGSAGTLDSISTTETLASGSKITVNKNLTSNSSATNTLNAETVTITGEVKTSVGANNIDGKDITINGSITNMWGNNTINATGAIKIGSQDKKVTISNDSNAATSN
ncbi:hypothetical protein CQA57_01785, partial [Helicobacter anseris]